MTQSTKIFLAFASGFAIAYTISKVLTSSKYEGEKEEDKPVKIKQTSPPFHGESKAPEENKNTTISKSLINEFPLQIGSESEKVKRLQIFLMRNLGWIRQPDGRFDLVTQKRVEKFFKVKAISQQLYQEFMLDKMVHDQRLNKVA